MIFNLLFKLPDDAGLVNTLKKLVDRIIDVSDHTNFTCAFIRQLQESVDNPALTKKFAGKVSSCSL